MRRVGGALVCVPAKPAKDAMTMDRESVYREYENTLVNAWRTP
jgi:hypothetical protein